MLPKNHNRVGLPIQSTHYHSAKENVIKRRRKKKKKQATAKEQKSEPSSTCPFRLTHHLLKSVELSYCPCRWWENRASCLGLVTSCNGRSLIRVLNTVQSQTVSIAANPTFHAPWKSRRHRYYTLQEPGKIIAVESCGTRASFDHMDKKTKSPQSTIDRSSISQSYAGILLLP